MGAVGQQALTDRGEVRALSDEPLHDRAGTQLSGPALALPAALPGGEHVDLLMGEPSLIGVVAQPHPGRSEEHTSELQSRGHLVCRLLLEKKKHKLRFIT